MATEQTNDRLGLIAVITLAEARRRLELAAAVVEAVSAAGPWPVVTYSARDNYHCLFCKAPVYQRDTIAHKDGCAGARIAALLAALDAEGRGGEGK